MLTADRAIYLRQTSATYYSTLIVWLELRPLSPEAICFPFFTPSHDTVCLHLSVPKNAHSKPTNVPSMGQRQDNLPRELRSKMLLVELFVQQAEYRHHRRRVLVWIWVIWGIDRQFQRTRDVTGIETIFISQVEDDDLLTCLFCLVCIGHRDAFDCSNADDFGWLPVRIK